MLLAHVKRLFITSDEAFSGLWIEISKQNEQNKVYNYNFINNNNNNKSTTHEYKIT